MLRRTLLPLVLAAGCAGLFAEPQLAAIASIGAEDYFVIRDTETHVVSPWLKLGDTYQNLRLSRFDRAAETLELKTANGIVHARLAIAHVRTGADAMPNTPFRLATGTAELRDGRIIYSPDALLRHDIHMIRATNGRLESDALTPHLVRGNMTILNPQGIVVISDATYNAATGRIIGQSIALPPSSKPVSTAR